MLRFTSNMSSNIKMNYNDNMNVDELHLLSVTAYATVNCKL